MCTVSLRVDSLSIRLKHNVSKQNGQCFVSPTNHRRKNDAVLRKTIVYECWQKTVTLLVQDLDIDDAIASNTIHKCHHFESKNFHGIFTAKFLSSHLIQRKRKRTLHPPPYFKDLSPMQKCMGYKITGYIALIQCVYCNSSTNIEDVTNNSKLKRPDWRKLEITNKNVIKVIWVFVMTNSNLYHYDDEVLIISDTTF